MTKATDVKIEFLNNVTEFFPRYFNETFEAIWLKNNGYATNADQSPKVILNTIFSRDFRYTLPVINIPICHL